MEVNDQLETVRFLIKILSVTCFKKNINNTRFRLKALTLSKLRNLVNI